MKLPTPGITVVTRIRGLAGSQERERLLDRLAGAAAAGATIIQIRDRLMADRELLAFTRELVERAAPSGCLVVVNDRIDVALAAGAHGVHLRSDGPPGSDVRRLVPEGFIVGRSIHRVSEAKACSDERVYDYLLFGTVYRSESKPDGHVPAGLGTLADACAAASVPVLAIGGIDVERAAQVARAGAAGIAAIGLFANAVDLDATVRDVRAALTRPDGAI